MRSTWRPSFDSREREAIAAQRIACSVLLHGCEVALTRFRLLHGEYWGGAEKARVEEILAGILSSWQETLDILETVSPERGDRRPREVLPAINPR